MGQNQRRNDMCSGWPDSLVGLGRGIREKERGERRVWIEREAGHMQWVAGFSCRSEVLRKTEVWLPSILPHKLLPVRTSKTQVETRVWGVWGARERGAVQLVQWDRRLLHVAAVDSALQELVDLSLLRKPRQRWRRWERGMRLCVFEKKLWLTLLGLTAFQLNTWPQV